MDFTAGFNGDLPFNEIGVCHGLEKMRRSLDEENEERSRFFGRSARSWHYGRSRCNDFPERIQGKRKKPEYDNKFSRQ